MRGSSAVFPAASSVELTVLIVDDDPDILSEQAELIEGIGFRCLAASSPERAHAIFESDPHINVVITDWSMPGEDGLTLIKSLGETSVPPRHFVAILLTGHPSIELAVQAMHNGVVDFLSKPATREAYQATLGRAAQRLDELQSSARESIDVVASVQSIQDSINALTQRLGIDAQDGQHEGGLEQAGAGKIGTVSSSSLKSILRARRNREKYFEGDLFSDPAWDILLELTVAHLEGRQESVTSVAIAASVPTSTAMRRIRELTDRGLLRRWADPNDARRIFVELTSDAAKRMLTMLSHLNQTPII